MKRLMKVLIAAVFYYSGIFLVVRLWNYLTGKRLTILTFHRITDSGASPAGGLPTISLSRANFESLIKFITKHYHVISLDEYLKHVHNGRKPRANCLILSFDDAYKEMRDNVLPLTRKYGLPTVLFVPTAAIDEGGFFWWDAFYVLLTGSESDLLVQKYLDEQPENARVRSLKAIASKSKQERDQAIFDFIEVLQKLGEEQRQAFVDFIIKMYHELGHGRSEVSTVLGWQEIRELHRAGMDIGSHTKNHPFLSTISHDEVEVELLESKDQLEKRIGGQVASFAYPGGKYTEETIRLVKEAGYACAFTADSGLNTFDDPVYKLKRINVWDNTVTGNTGKFSEAVSAWHLFLKH